jgi:hypothetical protein
MGYLIKYNDFFLADFFPTQWTDKPLSGCFFADEEQALFYVDQLCAKARSGKAKKGELVLYPDDFSVVWIDSPLMLSTVQKF